MIRFQIPMDPMAQPRVKARRLGNIVQIYTPENAAVQAYKTAIAEAFTRAAPDLEKPYNGPVALGIVFTFKRPQSRLNEVVHTIKPDVDNLAKAVMDALNSVAWHDDSQVIRLSVSKRWAPIIFGGSSGRKKMSADPNIEINISFLDTGC